LGIVASNGIEPEVRFRGATRPLPVVLFTNEICHKKILNHRKEITGGFILSEEQPLPPSEYITEDELEAKGYLTAHQSLDNYYTKYETDTKVNMAVASKANSVVFTSNKYVTKAIGDFSVDDNLCGLTIEQILAKLLELSDTKVNTPESGDDDETLGIIGTISKERTPMYSIDSNGVIRAVDFIEVERDSEPTKSGFYVVKDTNGKIIEGGYQDLVAEAENLPYMIALPKAIDYNTNVELRSYDSDTHTWEKSSLYLTSDQDMVNSICAQVGIDISHINLDEYTIWTTDEPGCTGSIYRFIIKEEA
jgi:hypothetical protein